MSAIRLVLSMVWVSCVAGAEWWQAVDNRTVSVGVLWPMRWLGLFGGPEQTARDPFVNAPIAGFLSAFHYINNNDQLLPGRVLRPEFRDTSGSVNPAMLSAMELNGLDVAPCASTASAPPPSVPCGAKRVEVVTGTLSETVTFAVADVFQSLNMPFLPPFSVDPTLSDQSTAIRLLPSAVSEMVSLVQVLQLFQWQRVAIVAEDSWSFADTMIQLCQSANITVISTQLVKPDAEKDKILSHMRVLQQTDARIFLVHAGNDVAYGLLQAADELGMLTPENVFVGTSLWTTNLPQNTALYPDADRLMRGVIGTSVAFDLSSDASQDMSAVMKKYLTAEYGALEASVAPFQAVPAVPQLAFDHVVLAARALTKLFWARDACAGLNATTLLEDLQPVPEELSVYHSKGATTCGHLELDDSDGAVHSRVQSDVLLALMLRESWYGSASYLTLNEFGDAEIPFVLFNHQTTGSMPVFMVDYTGEGSIQALSGTMQEAVDSIVWRGTEADDWLRSGSVPLDRPLVYRETESISDGAFYFIVGLAGAGVLVALCSLLFNVVYSNRRMIKLSSPTINNVCLVGCIVAYAAMPLLGLDVARLGDAPGRVVDTGVPSAESDSMEVVCNVRVWLMALAFTTAFGAIFSKTYRVHRIFNDNTHKVVEIRDWTLLSVVGALCVVDCIILLVWMVADPLAFELDAQSPVALPDELGASIIYERQECNSEYMDVWMPLLLVFNGLILVVGAWLAWETRKVHIPILNDSRWVALSIYNIFILMCVMVPLSLTIDLDMTQQFLLVAICIFAMASMIICFLFLPKLLAVVMDKEDEWFRAEQGSTYGTQFQKTSTGSQLQIFTTSSSGGGGGGTDEVEMKPTRSPTTSKCQACNSPTATAVAPSSDEECSTPSRSSISSSNISVEPSSSLDPSKVECDAGGNGVAV